MFGAALSDTDGIAEAAGSPQLLDEEAATGNISKLVTRWAEQVFGDDDEWQEMLASDEVGEFRAELELARNGTLVSWLEPLSDLLGRSTDPQLGLGDILDVDELVARVTLFPLLLASIAGRQGNLEVLLVYYITRLLGRLNVAALASYEGRELGSRSADMIVAEQEATFVRKAQQEVVNSVGIAIIINIALGFGLTAFIVWQVSNLLLGVLTPPPVDPLAF